MAGLVTLTAGGPSTLSTVTPTLSSVVCPMVSMAVAVTVAAPSGAPALSQDAE